MTITEFLLARIAEDEASARAATPGPWEWVGDPAADEAFLCTANGGAVISAYGNHTEGYIECNDPDRAYIARNNPARALAECATKRAIIEQCLELDRTVLDDNMWNVSEHDNILESLAAVYAGHPDYQQEWA